jgi:hypothetical protein
VARASLPANPTPASPGTDWNAVQRRLAELGAVSSRVDRLPAGACRFVCWLADRARPDRTHCVEAQADSEGGAVRLGLQRAAQWRGQHPLR